MTDSYWVVLILGLLILLLVVAGVVIYFVAIRPQPGPTGTTGPTGPTATTGTTGSGGSTGTTASTGPTGPTGTSLFGWNFGNIATAGPLGNAALGNAAALGGPVGNAAVGGSTRNTVTAGRSIAIPGGNFMDPCRVDGECQSGNCVQITAGGTKVCGFRDGVCLHHHVPGVNSPLNCDIDAPFCVMGACSPSALGAVTASTDLCRARGEHLFAVNGVCSATPGGVGSPCADSAACQGGLECTKDAHGMAVCTPVGLADALNRQTVTNVGFGVTSGPAVGPAVSSVNVAAIPTATYTPLPSHLNKNYIPPGSCSSRNRGS